MDKCEIILIGASGHGMVVLDMLELQNRTVRGFIDANKNIQHIEKYTVFHDELNFADFQSVRFIVTIGDNHIRRRIAREIQRDYEKAIHPKSIISHRAEIGLGTVIMAGSVVNAGVTIGEHCIINSNASVDHDCIIKDFVHISPGASLAGNVHVGECSHIGIGASVIQGITIGKDVIVGAGSVVIRNIPDGKKVVGNPAREIPM